MAESIKMKFRNHAEALHCDLTRIGVIAASTVDGLTVLVEPDLNGWEDVPPAIGKEILAAGLAACGVWVEIT